MKISAIICEYNPFHNGHIYHINKTKKENNVDSVVALMSGNYVQRGLPSSFSKYERAKIACEFGCDLVIELPIFSSIAPADIFSKNAVSILNKLNVVDILSFGSEDSIDKLKEAYKIIESNKGQFDELIRKNLADGLSYSRSYAKSFNELTKSELMSKSNNILAYNYISSLSETENKGKIKAYAVQRHGPSYDSEHKEDGFASASYIRKQIYAKDDVAGLVPRLAEEKIIDLDKYFSLIKMLYLRESDYSKYFEYDEDTVNYISKYIYDAETYDEFILAVSKKNFSKSKINRFLLSILLNIHADDISRDKNYGFILPLCANEKGLEVLKEIKDNSSVQIINKYKDINELDSQNKKDLEKMIKADEMYYLIKDMDIKNAYKMNLLSIRNKS